MLCLYGWREDSSVVARDRYQLRCDSQRPRVRSRDRAGATRGDCDPEDEGAIVIQPFSLKGSLRMVLTKEPDDVALISGHAGDFDSEAGQLQQRAANV